MAAPAAAVVPAGNLIANPGAETMLTGWTIGADFATTPYGSGADGYPTTTVSAGIGGGLRFFGGGNLSPATADQIVDVSAAATEIDAATVGAALGAYLGGFAGQGDAMVVTAVFRNAATAAVGTPLTVGPVTTADRQGLTTLLPRSNVALVPPGTRSILVRMTATGAGSNDGYGDNITLVLGPAPVVPPPPPPPPAPAGPAPITNSSITPEQAFTFPSTRKCVSRRNFKIRLKRPDTVSYLAARVNVNGRQVPVVVANERYRTIRGSILQRRRLTARVDLRGLPKGTFRVQIVAVTTSLRTIRDTRRYRTCAGRRA